MTCDANVPRACAGASWRKLTASDETQLFQLVTRIEIADATAYRTSAEECRQVLNSAQEHEIVGAYTESNQLIGYALLRLDREHNEAECSGGIDPAWRGNGIGREALAWQADRARELLDSQRPWRVSTHVDENQTDLVDLLFQRGFIPREGYLEVSRPLKWILPRIPRRAFTEIIPWDHSYDPQVRALWNRLTDSASARAQWEDYPDYLSPVCSMLALDVAGDRPKVIGFARTFVYPQDIAALGYSEGYVNEFLVEPQYGLETVGKAIVIAAMRACAAHGLEAISGGVATSKTDTIALLEELKFSERGRLRRYELVNEAAAQ